MMLRMGSKKSASPNGKPTVAFPRGTYYAVTWGIHKERRGMETAYMHRSRVFVRQAKVRVTIITYQHQEDLAEIIKDLRAKEVLIDGMEVINMWDDLRAWDDERLRGALATSVATDVKHFRPLEGCGNERTALRERLMEGERELKQADYFRADGTLMVSHRNRVDDSEEASVTFCDSVGKPIASFAGPRQLYRFWLDSLPKDPVAFMIIDSKTSANHFPEFRRDEVVSLYMIHGSHLADAEKPPHGQLSARRAPSFERLADYDGVVFLTERQRSDVQEALGPLSNLYVCPNSFEVVRTAANAPKRDEKLGIAVGALVGLKRFKHAIEAVRIAEDNGVSVRLHVFGRGPKHDQLQRVIGRESLHDKVQLAGYTSKPAAEMARASFLLMTSKREGFGLVLVEAMSQGCVPIAYDIAYGPSEIITDGVNGFLVEPGNVDELGSAIVKFVKMPRRKRQRMRQAAINGSMDFSDGAIVQRWAEIFNDALLRKIASSSSQRS